MRNSLWLIAATAALAAAPAAAQNNVAEPTANTTTELPATDANVALDANVVTGAPPADNGLEPAAPVATEAADTAAMDDDERARGFPWGLLGLIGLIGLLGRRRGD